ncbi:hypothetical protein HBI42_218660 [Parastagonospora nodorum]|nr:hypothetical protein HBI43_216210 [Parastagonospora nodorum]KAH6243386.1 hypothetical protein HBI42_218660 [Parastagonospora nodorum]
MCSWRDKLAAFGEQFTVIPSTYENPARSSQSSRNLVILLRNDHALRMNRAEIRILKETAKECFGSFL